MSDGCSTVREISQEWGKEIAGGQALSLWRLGNLLDDFRLRAKSKDQKMVLVREQPEWIESPSQQECNAYLAGMVETLCREVGLTPPSWTESPRCFLRRPWFAGGLENLKAILLAESPVAFRRRNLFVSADALTRV